MSQRVKGHALNDETYQNDKLWIAELTKAGWVETHRNARTCPRGYLWRGPYGAWCELQRRDKQIAAVMP